MSTKAGDLELKIPKLRTGSFFPSLLKRRRVDRTLYAVVMEAWVQGVSIRDGSSDIPTGLTVGNSGDLDGDDDASDTEFSWMAPSPPNGLIENYTVHVYVNAGQADCDAGAFARSYTSAGTATMVTAEDNGDVWTLVFNEEMNPATVAGATFTLTDADRDSILVECKAPAADTVTDAGCVLGNGADATVANDTLVITLGEDAQDRNAAGAGNILYPLTITAATGLTDLDDADTVNVAGSTDVTIG